MSPCSPPCPVFAAVRLSDIVDPQRAAPAALRELQHKGAGGVFNSSHWIWTECIRLTALSGLLYATEPEAGERFLKQQEDMMIKLGNMLQVAA